MTPKQIYINADRAAEALKRGNVPEALHILEKIKADTIREEARKICRYCS